jgi:CheY-like chemotaxis protein
MNMTAKQGTILVLDDEHNYAKMLMDLLVNRGFEAEICTSPTDALKLLKAREFSLVVADFKMPEMDGAEFLLALRKFLPEMPVIMVSGYMNTPELVKVANIGVTLVLEKPFDSNTFFDYVRRFVLIGSDTSAPEATETPEAGEEATVEDAPDLPDPDETPPTVFLAAQSRSSRSFINALWREFCKSAQLWIVAPPGPEVTLVLKDIIQWRDGNGLSRPLLLPAVQLDEEWVLDKMVEQFDKRFSEGGVIYVDYRDTPVDQQLTTRINGFFKWLNDRPEVRKEFTFVHGLARKIMEGSNLQYLPESVRNNLITLNDLKERPLDLATYIVRLLEQRNCQEAELTDEALALLLNYNWPDNYSELKSLVNRLEPRIAEGQMLIDAVEVRRVFENRHKETFELQQQLDLEAFMHRQQKQFLRESLKTGQSMDRLLKDIRSEDDESLQSTSPETMPFLFHSLISSISREAQ